MNSFQTAAGRLSEILGPNRVVTDRDVLAAYAEDETSDVRAMPDILVRAESAAEVSAILRFCHEHGIPVVPRGAGTGVTGGAVPVCGGVVLSLERMNRILEIDCENMVAVVEPCVVTRALQEAALAEGLMYPPDPASLDSCSIGGNVAEGAGGPRAVKYGTTKDYVLGLECVLPDGSIIETGGKFVKNATGYNITGILVGSEGTLAVITKIILRLIPAPKYAVDLLVPFDGIREAMEAVHTILRRRIIPATIEFMERDAIILVADYLRRAMPFPDAGAHLLIQVDGNDHDFLMADLDEIGSLLSVDPSSIITAESPLQRERIWKARRSIREAIQAASPIFLAEDCVVPRSRIPAFLVSLKEYLAGRGLRSVMFGHAGDGNVHVDVLKDRMDDGEWKAMLPDLKGEIYRRAVDQGGTITGEHGIGCVRRDYLHLALSREAIELHKRIKQAFDPKGILNPGKVF